MKFINYLVTLILVGLHIPIHAQVLEDGKIRIQRQCEDCFDGGDNDGDGLSDCFDPDCKEELFSDLKGDNIYLKSTISCSPCMVDYADLFYRLGIDNFEAASELCEKLTQFEQKSTEDPWHLIEKCIPFDEIPEWRELASFSPPQSIIDAIKDRNINWDVQTLNTASGAYVNVDYFEVCFDEIPNEMSPSEFLDEIRQNWFEFDEGCNSKFKFDEENLSNNDAILWASDSPQGTLFDIDIGLFDPRIQADDGSVVVSQYDNTECLCWTFTTIYAPGATQFDEGQHPVSGNRQFGLIEKDNGQWCFYTRGVDRLTNNLYSKYFAPALTYPANELFSRLALWAGEELWRCLLPNIGEFYDLDNPEVCGVRYRPDWEFFEEQIINQTLSESLSCLSDGGEISNLKCTD